MARKDILGQLARKPLGVQLAILAGVLVALGFGYWQFFYSSLQEEKAAAESRRKSSSKKIDELRTDAKELQALLREAEERRTKIKKGLLKLPAKSQLPAFLNNLQTVAANAKVKLKNYAQQAEIFVDDFIKVPYKIEATGTFHQLMYFFYLLWEYSEGESGLIITVENLTVKDATGGLDGIMLTATFNASTFRQAESGDAGDDARSDGDKADAADKSKSSKQKVEDAKQVRESAVDKTTGEATPADATAPPAAAGGKTEAGTDRLTNPGADGIR